MKKKRVLLPTTILLAVIVILFLTGCAGKKKELKTVQGDPAILYRQGLALFNKKAYKDALEKFEQIKSNFPDSPPYTQWAELKIADSHFLLKEYVVAAAAYEEFRKIHPTHEEIVYVHYQIGMSYFNLRTTFDRDQTFTQKALSSFEYLVANMPPSLLTEKAKDKIGLCKKELGEHECYIGEFYLRHGKYRAAVSRFERMLEKFPAWPEEDKILLHLGKGYLGMEDKEKATKRLNRLIEVYPKSRYAKEARTLLSGLSKGGLEKKGIFRKKMAGKKGGIRPAPKPEGPVLAKYEEEGNRAVSLIEEGPSAAKKEEHASLLPVTAEDVRSFPPEKRTEKTRGEAATTTVPEIPGKGMTSEAKEESGKTAPLEAQDKTGRSIPSGGKREEVAAPPAEEQMKVALIPGEEPPKTLSSTAPKVDPGVEDRPRGERKRASLPSLLAPSLEKEKPKSEMPVKPPADGKAPETAYPIDITSDTVETFTKENLILFKGNVLARQKDVVIYADSVQAFVIEDGKGIERVVAGGNVKIQQGLRVASCQKAVFYNLDKKVVMTGEPKVWEGDNIVSGDEIIFDIEQNRVEVKGGKSGRGKAKIYPQEEPKKKE